MRVTSLLTLRIVLVFVAFSVASCLNEDNLIPPNCYDGELNNGEELVDCGGPNCDQCDPCLNGVWEPELGEQWVDCGGECAPCESSFNGQLDPGEECIDCGGTTGVDCGELCNDGLPNGCEVEVDCGGDDCEACPTCTDGIMNGSEIGIDCGGIDCEPCPPGVNCTNGILDGDEIYIDCGGPNCNPCDYYINWTASGVYDEAVPPGSAYIQPSDLSLGGFGVGSNVSLILYNDINNWSSNSSFVLTQLVFDSGLLVWEDQALFGNQFRSDQEGASCTVTIDYIVPEANGVVKGSFVAVLVNPDGLGSRNVSGEFFLSVSEL